LGQPGPTHKKSAGPVGTPVADEETRVEAEAEVVSKTDSILTSRLVSMATKGAVTVVTATEAAVALSNEGDVVRWR